MGNSNKVLTVVFTILFIVLLAEVGYVAYGAFFKPKNNEAIPVNQGQVVSPSPALVRNGIQAVKQEMLNYVSYLNEGILTTSVLENQYNGGIFEVNIDNGLKIKIVGNNGATNTFSYSKAELPKISFFKTTGQSGGLEPITIHDLTVGDRVSIGEILNMLGDLNTNLVSTTITVEK